MNGRRLVWPWVTALSLLLALDQATKAWVRSSFGLHESVPIIGEEFLRLTYVKNPGIAFGLKLLSPHTLMWFGWAAAVLLAIYLYRLILRRDLLAYPILLFLAGALGNSIDRAVAGTVTDFVDVDFPDFIMERWPVFNVADSCVTLGITLLLLTAIFGPRMASRSQHTCQIVLPTLLPSI